VLFKNQLLFVKRPAQRISPAFAHRSSFRPEFRRGTQSKPSQWSVPVQSIRRFVRGSDGA
jgi:hypothetical protein